VSKKPQTTNRVDASRCGGLTIFMAGAKPFRRGGESSDGNPMRTTTLLLCLSLAGCAGANAAHSSFAPEPEAASAEGSPGFAGAVAQANDPPVLPGPMGQPSPRRSGKSKGKKSNDGANDTQNEEWWKEGGITREKINAMCWMKYENGSKDLPLDKRADLVDECVKHTLKEYPLR
jgi:hypothetical protein